MSRISFDNATVEVLQKILHRAARLENRHKEKMLRTGCHSAAEKMHSCRDAKEILAEVLRKEQQAVR